MHEIDFPSDVQATLTIDLGRIINNYQNCIKLAGDTKCAAMVKADAYGMGIAQVAPALFHQAGCKIFFVANLVEAIKLRQYVPEAVIYVLNGAFSEHLDYFVRYNIRPVLNDLKQIELWAKFENSDRPQCAVHFDTGINRLGLSPKETTFFIGNTDLRRQLDISLIMSHLACSDDPNNPMNKQQRDDFRAITHHFPNVTASLANSGGILLGSDYHFDLARPGLLMFGGDPRIAPRLSPIAGNIRPAYHISGKILQIRRLEGGQSVGYGATWTAKSPRQIATVNIGYADGYLQMFNNCGLAYIHNTMVPIVGRVSMDMIAVDVTDIDPNKISTGCDVELLGEHITLEMASEVSNLSQYEILTGVKERYQRIYK
ncbi:MAG: alanine racemase [Emcibacter sp.]|nr:alanine racemase [Emcibacter sp.]